MRAQGAGKRGSRRKAAANNGRRGSGGGSRKSSKSAKEPSTFWRWFKRLFFWGTALTLIGLLFVAVSVGFAAQSIPNFHDLKATKNAQTIVVRARDGSEIVEIGPSYGEWLSHDEIPKNMTNAMVAVEDRRFHSHFGIDPIRLTGAIVEGITGARSRLGGTSTITQQLARNVFLNNNRTLDRKAREAVLAMALEWKFSKEQILELYLNKVYFGGGAYGIDSASRKFFSHPATELNVAEASIIAGLVKAPSRYSPTADVEAAVDRAKVVLRLMREQGYITQEQASVNVDAVKLKKERGQNSVRYFTDWALPQLDILLPETFEPIEVWTTLDTGMQRAATASIQANTPGGAQGALVSMDRDGAILALVGGTDYVETNFNRATQAMRQPGSSFKLFVYLAALEAGYRPEDKVDDKKITIDGWSPRNSSGRYSGEMSLRTAFSFSVNTVAAQLGSDVGLGSVASMARRLGVTSSISAVPSMTLGSNEVRLIEMTHAFGTVSARGKSIKPYGITKVVTASGETIYQHKEEPGKDVLPDYVAAGITDLLETAVESGTGKAAQIGRPVAGKTGTTSSNKDGYFVGFSSGITTGVWMGRDDNKKVAGLQGGRSPARAFAAFMRYAVKDRPVEEFITDIERPEWQRESDQDSNFDDPDDYYYIDEQGNLIEPGQAGLRDSEFNEAPLDDPVAPAPVEVIRPNAPSIPEEDQAADDDFLEQAIGRPLAPDNPPAPEPEPAPF
ncbi:MAG: PBP1A family penicillin-binding protein [Marinomonas sp.]|uniref:transglycosylase domain-containing protein n=1 Tax=Parasphingorhabdus sp. TaxID=2709688 RepID=UPI0032788B30